MIAEKIEVEEIKEEELTTVLERARAVLPEEDFNKINKVVIAYLYLTRLLEKKNTTLHRLRSIIFGSKSEKTKNVLQIEKQKEEKNETIPQNKPKGHGRNGHDAYIGAEHINVSHQALHSGDCCPGCIKGKVYNLAEPERLVHVVGQAPLSATVYELERLRCNLCGTVFKAKPPPGVELVKYDETASSMISLLKYGSGVPFNRLQKLEQNLGIPLPATTQWEIVEQAATQIEPAFDELIHQAAQGKVLHNDDTSMKILELSKKSEDESSNEKSPKNELLEDLPDDRTGVFTSSILSVHNDYKIALFLTGRRHAGENLHDVLKQRAQELSSPIQMCDALSRNMPKALQTIIANCLSHARRKFVDVVNSFPDECCFLLETLKNVYKNDKTTKDNDMSDNERLAFHKINSAPLMASLKKWAEDLLLNKKVEPNSGLGEALTYLLKHWEKLTLFLRQPGAPLDNNICERALKKAILHRKNALFYKTQHGADVGDLFMSLIYSCELNNANPFHYLTELQRHAKLLAENPSQWMPWNYKNTLQALNTPKVSSGP